MSAFSSDNQPGLYTESIRREQIRISPLYARGPSQSFVSLLAGNPFVQAII
jgi:hypothetical protein